MSVNWVVCAAPNCTGACAPQSRVCVRHLQGNAQLQAAVRAGLDARGVLVDPPLWARLRAVAPPAGLGDALFDEATFLASDLGDTRFGRASFAGARFQDRTSFARSKFISGDFGGAHFDGHASFHDVEATQHLSFNHTQFASSALFTYVRAQSADFLEATFSGTVSFARSSVGRLALNFATFAGEVQLQHLRADSASFVGARFADDLDLSEARFHDLNLDRIRYTRSLELGPVTSLRLFSIEDAVFEEPFTLVATANFLSLAGTRFRAQARLDVRWAEIALDRVVFERPSVVAYRRKGNDDDEIVATCDERRRTPHPRIVSLRDADVEDLFLAGVDLRACRVHGARNLDRLRIGSGCKFAPSPPGPRWTNREVLAEEHLWRAKRGRGLWNPVECHAPDWVRDADEIPPEGVIAELYRDLRKAREDHKDEPGAASFYYGEMEMRRHSHVGAEWAERWILTLYWLVAGYGLRASRALAALAVTVLVFAAIFATWGFTPDQGYGRALLFSAESTSSLFRLPPTTEFDLTPTGEVAQLAVRLLGPLFFALALISLRGRVKRG